MNTTLLVLILALFVAAFFLRHAIGLAARFAFYFLVAVLVATGEYGDQVGSWITTPERLGMLLLAAAVGLGVGLAASLLVLRRSALRGVLSPVLGAAASAGTVLILV